MDEPEETQPVVGIGLVTWVMICLNGGFEWEEVPAAEPDED